MPTSLPVTLALAPLLASAAGTPDAASAPEETLVAWVVSCALLLAWLVGLYLISHRLELRLASRDEARRRLLGRGAVRWVRRVVVFGAALGGAFLFARFGPLPAEVQTWLATTAEPWVRATVAAVAALLVGLFAVRRLIAFFEARVAETEGTLDDIVLDALSRPAYLLVCLLAGGLWVGLLPIDGRPLAVLDAVRDAAVILLVILFLDGLLQGWIHARTPTSKVLQTSGVVIRTAARALLYTVGGLTVLASLGVNITPALATLGIGSAALGFALQGTVTDFLAGLMIAADQPVRVGDYIIIDDRHQGWVLTIGWRTTRLLTRMDTEVIVPNSKLAAAVFVNTSLPEAHGRFQVAVFLGPREDLDLAVALGTEMAEAVTREDPRAHPGDRAFAFIHEVQPGRVEMRTWLCAKDYDAHFGLRDAYLRQLSRTLSARGIALQPPVHAVELHAAGPAPFTPPPDDRRHT